MSLQDRGNRPLSPQEVRIVDLIAAGLPNKEIAGQMGLVEGTVKVYISRSIYRKLGISTRYELISLYWRERSERCFTCGYKLPGAGHPDFPPRSAE